MATLFQLHSDLDCLKSKLRELAVLLQNAELANEGQGDKQNHDKVILLDKTPSYIEWVFTHFAQIMQELEKKPKIDWFALADDVEALADTAKENLDFASYQIELLTDSEWVSLTQQVDKVVTLS